jgi:hypothetical protein
MWLLTRKNGNKNTNTFHCNTFQNLPKFGFFWFENMPSGNPGTEYKISLLRHVQKSDENF